MTSKKYEVKIWVQSIANKGIVEFTSDTLKSIGISTPSHYFSTARGCGWIRKIGYTQAIGSTNYVNKWLVSMKRREI